MSGFKHFAIAGAGTVGGPIGHELLSYKESGEIDSLVILTRHENPTPAIDKLIDAGAETRVVDYDMHESLVSALKGVDVVISTISSYAIASDAQDQLARACKDADVKLFVPSEFGVATEPDQGYFLSYKTALHPRLREMDLPYALFFNGVLADWFFNPLFDLDFASGEITIAGDGNTPISSTALPDIASYVAYVLVHLPKEKLLWKIFRIEGQRISLNDLAKAYRERSGNPLHIYRQSRAELEERANDPRDLPAGMLMILESGHGNVGPVEQLTTGLYPGWNPRKVVDVIFNQRPEGR